MYAGNVHRNPNIVITFGASQSGHDVSITHLQNGSKYMVSTRDGDGDMYLYARRLDTSCASIYIYYVDNDFCHVGGMYTRKRMFTVYTDMCADLCHYGHFAFIDKMVDIAREVNDESIPIRVVVGIHNDATIESYKRRPIMSMTERCRMISYHPLVDHVVRDAPLSPSLEYLAVYAVRLVCIGPRSDAEMQLMYGHIPASMLKRIPYTDGVSTTDIINRVRSHCMIKDTSIQPHVSHTSNNTLDEI